MEQIVQYSPLAAKTNIYIIKMVIIRKKCDFCIALNSIKKFMEFELNENTNEIILTPKSYYILDKIDRKFSTLWGHMILNYKNYEIIYKPDLARDENGCLTFGIEVRKNKMKIRDDEIDRSHVNPIIKLQ